MLLYHFVNDFKEVPKCLNCKTNNRIFKNFNFGYTRFCCVDCANNCELTYEKRKQTCLEKYGVENVFQSETCKANIRATNLDKIGVEYPGQSEACRDKMRKTNLEKYGAEYPLQSEICKDKLKNTCLEVYNADNPWKCDVIREKIKNTCYAKYGVRSIMGSKEFREKAKQTCQLKWGVDNPMQDVDILTKSQKTGFKLKKYTLPNNENIEIQGYEPQFLDWYFNNEGKLEDLVYDKKDMPKIKYKFKGKDKVYHPDFYIKSTNTIIEVKSTWTYEQHLEQNLAKQKACLEENYNFEFKIMNFVGNLL